MGDLPANGVCRGRVEGDEEEGEGDERKDEKEGMDQPGSRGRGGK